MNYDDFDVPAEIVIERPSYNGRSHNGWDWSWAVCQPDACWGEWAGGYASTKEKAQEQAVAALRWVHQQQGFYNYDIDPYWDSGVRDA